MTIQEFDNSVLGYQNKIKELEADKDRWQLIAQEVDSELGKENKRLTEASKKAIEQIIVGNWKSAMAILQKALEE